MNFEIISVGTELLLGQIVNTNAQAISRMLSELGMNVYYTTVVGDNPERLRAALEIAASRPLRRLPHRLRHPLRPVLRRPQHLPLLFWHH